MKKQWIVVGVIVAVLAAATMVVIQLSPQIFPVEVGSTAPAFTAKDLKTGQSVTLADYKGEVVLLNVWATWCEPCKIEMPSMEQLEKTMGAKGLKIVAVSVDEGGDDVVRQFVRDYGLSFRVLHDQSRTIERIYQTTGVPESFVINRQGTIVKKVIGAADWDATINRDLITRLLAQRS